jgi:hypothetical protein
MGRFWEICGGVFAGRMLGAERVFREILFCERLFADLLGKSAQAAEGHFRATRLDKPWVFRWVDFFLTKK